MSLIPGISNTLVAASSTPAVALLKASQAATASQAASAPVTQSSPAVKVSPQAAAAISSLSTAKPASSPPSPLTAAQINAMTKAQVQALSVADIPVSQIPSLTVGLTNMSGAQIGALSTPQLAALTATQVGSLGASLFPSLSDAQFAALSTAAYSGLTASEAGSLDANEIASLGTGVAKLSASAIAGLGSTQIGALSNAQAGAMSSTQLNAMTSAEIGALSNSQISSISSTALAGLSPAALSKMSSAQLGAMTGGQFGALSGAAINGLSSAVLKSLSTSEVSSLSTAAVSALSAPTLGAMTSAQLGSLTGTQVQALTTAQVAGLSQSALSSLNLSYFGARQVAALGASTVSSMSVPQFDAVVAPNIASLSAAAVKGVTTAQIQSLTAQQASALTSAQLSAMTASQKAAAAAVYSVMKDAQSLETNGALSYQDLLQVLEDAATNGMNASKFSDLQTLAKDLNASGANGIQTSAYVQQIFDDAVLGNAANAVYNGGSTAASKLGNLTASSSQTQVTELIGKWFLGTDNPSLAGYTATYQTVNEPLFSNGGPQVADVNQGEAGDCYFLAALADTAQQDPSLIQNMVKSNGNGTYSVEFQLNGKADYVTVNNQLAMLPSGRAMADGSTYAFDHGGSAGSANDWSAIVEKAYAEFREQTDGVNSYANIAGGLDNGLNAITGQAVSDSGNIRNAAQQSSLLQAMQAALASGNDVIMSSDNSNASLNLVGDHVFAVTGVNVATGVVTLDNPWNGSGANSSIKMQFTESLSALLANGAGFHIATGTPATA